MKFISTHRAWEAGRLRPSERASYKLGQSPLFLRWTALDSKSEKRSPMVTPFERVRKAGLATGHNKVSIAACMMNKSEIWPSQEPCRTPIELPTSELFRSNFHINQSAFVKANYDVEEMIRRTEEATEYYKQTFPSRSIKSFHHVNKRKANKECPHFKPMFFLRL